MALAAVSASIAGCSGGPQRPGAAMRINAIAGLPGTIFRIVASPWWISEVQFRYFGPPARITQVEVRSFGNPLWGRAIVADDGTPRTTKGVVSGAVYSAPGYPRVWNISPHTFARQAELKNDHTYSLIIFVDLKKSQLLGGFTGLRFTVAGGSASISKRFDNVAAYECGGRANGKWKACEALMSRKNRYRQNWVGLLKSPTVVGGDRGT